VVKKLVHGLLLDSKYVMDNAMPSLRQSLSNMVPSKLHEELEGILCLFEEELVGCDVANDYVEKKY
jgi:hypothetical protein